MRLFWRSEFIYSNAIVFNFNVDYSIKLLHNTATKSTYPIYKIQSIFEGYFFQQTSLFKLIEKIIKHSIICYYNKNAYIRPS